MTMKRSARVYAIDIFKVSDHNGIELWSYDRRVGLSRFVSKVSVTVSHNVNRIHEQRHYFDYPLFY